MLNLTLIICLVISLAITYLVIVKPLFMDAAADYFQSSAIQPEFDTSLSLLESIAELETDYRMGKLSQSDFDALSLEYKRNYLELQKKEGK